MPLFEFKETHVWKAFFLNALASTLLILFAFEIRSFFEHHVDVNNQKIERRTTWGGIALTLGGTFLAALGAFGILYVLFGFGEGMVV